VTVLVERTNNLQLDATKRGKTSESLTNLIISSSYIIDFLGSYCKLFKQYECTVDYELADAAPYAPDRRCVCFTRWQHFSAWSDDMATELNVWRHVNQFIFTWRTILPNFISIRFETTKHLLFWRRSPQQETRRRRTRTTGWAAIWDQFLIQNSAWSLIKNEKPEIRGKPNWSVSVRPNKLHILFI